MNFPARTFLLLGWFFGLSACAPRAIFPAESAAPPLTPYFTPTLAMLPSALPTAGATFSAPAATPTPQVHVIAAGETISGLAQRYGLTVDEILALNPGLQPQALTIGQTIFLPAPGADRPQALPTPLALMVGAPRCFPQADGLWCLALVSNPAGGRVALLTGQMNLVDAAGTVLASQPALSLLDGLPEGAALPLAAFFAAPPQGTAGARLQILTALGVSAQAAPPLPRLGNLLSQVELSGRVARISGTVFLPENASAVSQIWLAVLGYERGGELVAFRRVELDSSLAPGESLPFALELFSLGPALWRVEVFAEGH
ncbi:MAG: hypothetical protein OHK0031_18300 [Anaerolineales bacterium]